MLLNGIYLEKTRGCYSRHTDLNAQIWLANHAHVTGPAFNDTAHGPDFIPAA